MSAVLKFPVETSPLVDTAPFDALVSVSDKPAKRLSDAPHPRTNDECIQWADKFRTTLDPRWFAGLKVAASLMALRLFNDERARTLDETFDRALHDYLTEEARGIEALVIAEAIELCARWVPERGALGTWLHKPVLGVIRDAFAKSRKIYVSEALVEGGNWLPTEFEDEGNYRSSTRDGSLKIIGKHSDPTPRGVKFKSEPELKSLIKRLAAGLFDNMSYLSDERAILFHILIPQAHGDEGLTDAELAEKLHRPRLWVLRKRHQLLAEMRQALAEAGVTE